MRHPIEFGFQRSPSALLFLAARGRMFQGIAVNDQDQAKNDANLMSAQAADLLAQQSHELDDEDGDEELEQEFADGEEVGDDLSDDEAAQFADEMKNKMDSLFEIDGDEEPEMSELDVLSLEEAAVYLKVNYGDVRQLIKEQALPGRKIGSEWRFLRGAIADWLRTPGAAAAKPAVAAARAERPREEQRPAREERPRRRFPEELSDGGEGYPEQSRPPRPRPQFRSQEQFSGGPPAGGLPSGGGQAGGGQGGYPPPRRGRYADQQQQPPQGEYQPPARKRPFQGQAGGNAGGPPPAGGRRFGTPGGAGQGGAGQGGAGRFSGGPKAPKREALGNQRFKRLDRRRFGGDQGE